MSCVTHDFETRVTFVWKMYIMSMFKSSITYVSVLDVKYIVVDFKEHRTCTNEVFIVLSSKISYGKSPT